MLNLEVKGMPKNGNLDLQEFIKTERKILNKEFRSTYLCNRLLHRAVREGGEGSYGWLCGCSHEILLFCTACAAVLMKDDGGDAGWHDEVEDLQLFYASLMMYR